MMFCRSALSVASICVALFVSCVAFAAGPTLKSGTPAPQNTYQNLLSHRATYDLALSRVSQSDGVRAASGTMTFTLTDRCDGYTIESHLSMTMAFANGSDNQVEQRYAAWESKDGRSSTFRLQVMENGKLAKAYRGDIQLQDDGSGVATYESDQVAKFDLPPGTLLSTAHTLQLLNSAASHERFVARMVIDGSFDEGPFWVTAAIAPSLQTPKASPKAGDAPSLDQGPYWPIGMAYFPAVSQQELPEYEVTQHLFTTGITHSMLQDFGGFALAFKPVRFEPVAVTACP